MTPLVLKCGGELLEDPAHLATIVAAVAGAQGSSLLVPMIPMIVVHGGGREIDVALKRAGIEKRQVDGLRITDQATLDVVVSVLAGSVNTRLVAALVASGSRAVGLTGVDARCGLSQRAPLHRCADGRTVDLGHVGVPVSPVRNVDDGNSDLLETLLTDGFVPVIASIGVDEDGRLLNVNADTLAGHLAARVRARRLIIAGTTAGVLGDGGATIPRLESSAIAALVASGTATAGMIAKLRACEHALARGVDDIVIVDGRDRAALQSAIAGDVPARATHLVALASAKAAR